MITFRMLRGAQVTKNEMQMIVRIMFALLLLGAVHKLRHFKIDLYGSSNNDST